jgi:hypothetical protein
MSWPRQKPGAPTTVWAKGTVQISTSYSTYFRVSAYFISIFIFVISCHLPLTKLYLRGLHSCNCADVDCLMIDIIYFLMSDRASVKSRLRKERNSFSEACDSFVFYMMSENGQSPKSPKSWALYVYLQEWYILNSELISIIIVLVSNLNFTPKGTHLLLRLSCFVVIHFPGVAPGLSWLECERA